MGAVETTGCGPLPGGVMHGGMLGSSGIFGTFNAAVAGSPIVEGDMGGGGDEGSSIVGGAAADAVMPGWPSVVCSVVRGISHRCAVEGSVGAASDTVGVGVGHSTAGVDAASNAFALRHLLICLATRMAVAAVAAVTAVKMNTLFLIFLFR